MEIPSHLIDQVDYVRKLEERLGYRPGPSQLMMRLKVTPKHAKLLLEYL